jgi:hypothetical protein
MARLELECAQGVAFDGRSGEDGVDLTAATRFEPGFGENACDTRLRSVRPLSLQSEPGLVRCRVKPPGVGMSLATVRSPESSRSQQAVKVSRKNAAGRRGSDFVPSTVP